MKRLTQIIAIAIGFLVISEAQNLGFNTEKPGSCPPKQPVSLCSRSCQSDADCEAEGKCCPTSCGGNICSVPVTQQPAPTVKSGSCPVTPTGRWVCTPTCSADSDCRNTKKCCKNRCGVLVCQTPSVDTLEFVDTSYQPEPNNSPDDVNTINLNPKNPFLFSNK